MFNDWYRSNLHLRQHLRQLSIYVSICQDENPEEKMEANVRKKTGWRRDQDQMWKCCLLKLVYATARDEVSRLTRERNWKVWNPPREVVHQLQEPSWQVVCHQCCGFIVLLADPLSPPPRPYFVLGQLQEAWQVHGWLLASPYLFFRASSKPSSRRDHLDTRNTSGKTPHTLVKLHMSCHRVSNSWTPSNNLCS